MKKSNHVRPFQDAVGSLNMPMAKAIAQVSSEVGTMPCTQWKGTAKLHGKGCGCRKDGKQGHQYSNGCLQTQFIEDCVDAFLIYFTMLTNETETETMCVVRVG